MRPIKQQPYHFFGTSTARSLDDIASAATPTMDTTGSPPRDPVSFQLLGERMRNNEQIRGNHDLRPGELFLDSDAFSHVNAFLGTTMNTPHELVEFDGKTYFIASFPERDYVIHRWDPGTDLTFLLEDGSFKTVHGPYQMARRSQDFKAALVRHLQRTELFNKATKITVGTCDRINRGTHHDLRMVDIVYKEAVRTLDPILPRILASWHALDIKCDKRNEGTSYCKVAHLLTKAEADI